MCLCFGKATAYHHIKVVLKTQNIRESCWGSVKLWRLIYTMRRIWLNAVRDR